MTSRSPANGSAPKWNILYAPGAADPDACGVSLTGKHIPATPQRILEWSTNRHAVPDPSMLGSQDCDSALSIAANVCSSRIHRPNARYSSDRPRRSHRHPVRTRKRVPYTTVSSRSGTALHHLLDRIYLSTQSPTSDTQGTLPKCCQPISWMNFRAVVAGCRLLTDSPPHRDRSRRRRGLGKPNRAAS